MLSLMKKSLAVLYSDRDLHLQLGHEGSHALNLPLLQHMIVKKKGKEVEWQQHAWLSVETPQHSQEQPVPLLQFVVGMKRRQGSGWQQHAWLCVMTPLHSPGELGL